MTYCMYFYVFSEEFQYRGGIPSPLALFLLVTFYDTQKIRWRSSFVIAHHHRATSKTPIICIVGYPPRLREPAKV